MKVAQPSVVLLFYNVLNLLQNDSKTEGIDLSTYALCLSFYEEKFYLVFTVLAFDHGL